MKTMATSNQLKVARRLLAGFVKQMEGDAPVRGGLAQRYKPLVDEARTLLALPEPEEHDHGR